MKHSFSMYAQDIKIILERVKLSVGNYTRPNISGINVELKAGKVIFTATNGVRLTMAESLNVESQTISDISFILEDYEELYDIVKKKTMKDFDFLGKFIFEVDCNSKVYGDILFECSKWSVRLGILELNYPDYRKVIPDITIEHNHKKAVFDPILMGFIMKACKHPDKRTQNKVRMWTPKDNESAILIEVNLVEYNLKITNLLMPVKEYTNEFRLEKV